MNTEQSKKTISWGKILFVVLLLAFCVFGAAAWWIYSNINARPIEATQLSAAESKVLEQKLERLEHAASAQDTNDKTAVPEAYSEEGASREIVFSERELNSLLSGDPEFAKRVAVDLSPDLVSVTALIPIDPEFPIGGGRILKLRLGVKLAYSKAEPIVALQGVSLGGVPIPRAWLGDLKYKNLVAEFRGAGGFWDSFSAGVEDLKVGEEKLILKLRE